MIVLEDLHWVDPSTMELTQILVEQGATAPLLLLYTARPEFRAPWPMRAYHAQVTLNRVQVRPVGRHQIHKEVALDLETLGQRRLRRRSRKALEVGHSARRLARELTRHFHRPFQGLALRQLIHETEGGRFAWGAPRIHGEFLKRDIEISAR